MTAILAALVLVPMRPAAPATAVLNTAQAQAKRESKNVLVLFKASWCRWCGEFEGLLDDPALDSAWKRSYIVARINVRERGEQKALENPGWEEVMRRLRGSDDMDVPYMAILAPSGRKLADSLRVGSGPIPANAGYPAKPDEIAAFEAAIRTTSKFTPDDLQTLDRRLAQK